MIISLISPLLSSLVSLLKVPLYSFSTRDFASDIATFSTVSSKLALLFSFRFRAHISSLLAFVGFTLFAFIIFLSAISA